MTTEPDKITEKTVRDRLLRQFKPFSELIAFNLCGVGKYPHEMDLMRVLDSGYVQEYEIKISRSDIVAEAKKAVKYADLTEGALRRISTQWRGKPVDLAECVHPDQVTNPYLESVGAHGFKSVMARYKTPIRQFWIAVPSRLELAQFACDTLPAWVGVLALDSRPRLWSDMVVRNASKLTHCRVINDIERMDVMRRMSSKYWSLYFERGGTGRG